MSERRWKPSNSSVLHVYCHTHLCQEPRGSILTCLHEPSRRREPKADTYGSKEEARKNRHASRDSALPARASAMVMRSDLRRSAREADAPYLATAAQYTSPAFGIGMMELSSCGCCRGCSACSRAYAIAINCGSCRNVLYISMPAGLPDALQYYPLQLLWCVGGSLSDGFEIALISLLSYAQSYEKPRAKAGPKVHFRSDLDAMKKPSPPGQNVQTQLGDVRWEMRAPPLHPPCATLAILFSFGRQIAHWPSMP